MLTNYPNQNNQVSKKISASTMHLHLTNEATNRGNKFNKTQIIVCFYRLPE